jgi:hypothetical protein
MKYTAMAYAVRNVSEGVSARRNSILRITDPIDGVEPGPVVETVNDGGVTCWSSVNTKALLEEADLLTKTSPWVTDGRGRVKTKAEKANEEAKRRVEACEEDTGLMAKEDAVPPWTKPVDVRPSVPQVKAMQYARDILPEYRAKYLAERISHSPGFYVWDSVLWIDPL